MILLLKDWLEMAKERVNLVLFGIISISLLFPNTIEAKETIEKVEVNGFDNQVNIEEVIVKTHKNMVNSATGAADIEDKKEVYTPDVTRSYYVTATAYTSTPDQCWGNPFITASGKRVYDGLIAANGLKFGTKVRFPEMYGDKIFTVDDRMSSRHGSNRVDIWMDGPRSKALQFGKRYLKMEILES